ncbi:MAG: hypothetical protein AAF213_01345 [Pseudomonadota bacterium]
MITPQTDGIPDYVIQGLTRASDPGLPGLAAKTRQETGVQPIDRMPDPHHPPMSVAQSKAVIVEAAMAFDPQLGARVKAVCDDPDRFNIREVEPGTARMMRVRTRDCAMTENNPLFVSAERMGEEDWARWQAWEQETGKPAFTLNANDTGKAQIDYEHDSTVTATTYLAHEIGHAVADDIQWGTRNTNSDNPKHMAEIQAYALQHIVLSHLTQQSDPALAATAEGVQQADDAAQRHSFAVGQIAASALDGQGEVSFAEKFGGQVDGVLDHHQGAQTLFEALRHRDTSGHERLGNAPVDTRTIQNAAHAVQGRAGQNMAARILVDHIRNAPAAERAAVLGDIMGGHGPKCLDEVMQGAGLESQADIEATARATFGTEGLDATVTNATSNLAGWKTNRHTAAKAAACASDQPTLDSNQTAKRSIA